MSATPTIQRLLAASVNVAERSGSIVRKVWSSGELGIVEKESKYDLQTEADRAVQRCIISSLQAQFPDITIIGEEDNLVYSNDPDFLELTLSEDVLKQECPADYVEAKDSELVVWVDPLDGTNEFTQGFLDHVTVLIGLAWKGKSVGGVVHQPYYNYKKEGAEIGRTMWGLIGLGTFGNELNKLKEGNIIATTKMLSNYTVNETVKACEPTDIVRVGAAGFKILLVLDGIVHAYVFASPVTKKWDTCAPEALLRASGGKLTDIHGSDLTYHKEVQVANSAGILATLHSDHQWYMSKIPQCVKDSLPAVLSSST